MQQIRQITRRFLKRISTITKRSVEAYGKSGGGERGTYFTLQVLDALQQKDTRPNPLRGPEGDV